MLSVSGCVLLPPVAQKRSLAEVSFRAAPTAERHVKRNSEPMFKETLSVCARPQDSLVVRIPTIPLSRYGRSVTILG
jgi:hypothetical protein